MPHRSRAWSSGTCLVALAALVLSGCGGSQDDAVSEVAAEFYAAVADGDGAAACAILVPSTRSELEQASGEECAVAILEEAPAVRGDRGHVEVFDTMAQVHWGDDTAFLARMEDGWRLMALACTPRPSGPYDCQVSGG